MYKYETTVRLFDTDAAGVLFFGNQFRMAHAAYEEFMASRGVGFRKILSDNKVMLPITKAEADFKRPLGVGDSLTIELKAESITENSYTLAFDLKSEKNKLCGTIRTVHVCVDAQTWKKTPLPSEIREALQSIIQ